MNGPDYTQRRALPDSVPHADTCLHIESQCHATALGLGLTLADAGLVDWAAIDPGDAHPNAYYSVLITRLEEQLLATRMLDRQELDSLPDDDTDHHGVH